MSLLRSITRKDRSLDGSAVGNSLIRIDALVWFLAVKEVGDEFDDTGDTGGTADQNDFVDVRLVDLGIAKDLLDRVKSPTEEILAKLLEAGTSEGGIEINTLKE